MRRLLTSFILLLGGAAAAHAAPPLPIVDAASIEKGHAVFLPEKSEIAIRLVHQWNAQAALLGATSGTAASLEVPTLGALFAPKPDGAAPIAFGPWREALASVHTGLGAHASDAFPLAKGPACLVLLTPGADHQTRMQAFVDHTLRSEGYGDPPRPDPSAGKELSLARASRQLWQESGMAQIGWRNSIMLALGFLLLYLAIYKRFEPLVLIPIAIGGIFANSIGAGMAVAGTGGEPSGILYYFTEYGLVSGIFPLLVLLGIGALTDFGPMLANPWSVLLGAAAQFGIFGTFVLAVLFGFDLRDAGAIAIIGGAGGPTSIYVASRLAPDMLGAIAVAAYTYMALLPIIQPPIMKLLTTDAERRVMMTQAKEVSKAARILFPIVVTLLCILTLPSAVPLIGMLMFGNLLRECGVTERLSHTAQNELINIVTIGLGTAVGTKLSADKFLNPQTLGIIVLGCIAFVLGTAGGVLFGKIMCWATGGKVNPLIGSAGVSAVPMAARVSQNVGQLYNRHNDLLMHAMGPNVSGVIGSAVAAGILLALLK